MKAQLMYLYTFSYLKRSIAFIFTFYVSGPKLKLKSLFRDGTCCQVCILIENFPEKFVYVTPAASCWILGFERICLLITYL